MINSWSYMLSILWKKWIENDFFVENGWESVCCFPKTYIWACMLWSWSCALSTFTKAVHALTIFAKSFCSMVQTYLRKQCHQTDSSHFPSILDSNFSHYVEWRLLREVILLLHKLRRRICQSTIAVPCQHSLTRYRQFPPHSILLRFPSHECMFYLILTILYT